MCEVDLAYVEFCIISCCITRSSLKPRGQSTFRPIVAVAYGMLIQTIGRSLDLIISF